jgi:hypothetical protein
MVKTRSKLGQNPQIIDKPALRKENSKAKTKEERKKTTEVQKPKQSTAEPVSNSQWTKLTKCKEVPGKLMIYISILSVLLTFFCEKL